MRCKFAKGAEGKFEIEIKCPFLSNLDVGSEKWKLPGKDFGALFEGFTSSVGEGEGLQMEVKWVAKKEEKKKK